ncbi:MAG: Fibronectin type protein, partial [Frankiales bacterium]|nr:Fibronectin type protein [Frankiales bacterium]
SVGSAARRLPLPDDQELRRMRSISSARLSRLSRSRRSRLTVIAIVLTALLATALQLPQQAFAAVNPHSPIGRFDTLAMTNGQLAVRGWVLDPDGHGPIHADVYITNTATGARRGIRTVANAARPDIGRAYPAWGAAHGISLTVAEPNGTYQVCVYGINAGPGANTGLGCRQLVVNNNPSGAVTSLQRVPGGLAVAGWAADPNSAGPIAVDVYVDKTARRLAANVPTTASLRAFPNYGKNHGFSATLSVAAGVHQICVYAINVGAGTTNPTLSCQSVTVSANPFGKLDSVTRVSATTMLVQGWAIDPDTLAATTVRFTADGVAVGSTYPTTVARPDVTTVYPAYPGKPHGYRVTVPVDAAEHQVCLVAVNAAATPGSDVVGNCRDLPAQNATAPPVPTNIQAWPGNGSGVVGWTAPATSGGAQVDAYRVTLVPTGKSVVVPVTTNQVSMGGLTNGKPYAFTVAAHNIKGWGTAAKSATVKPSLLPPQITPAPVSTSRYIRDLTGNAATDAALMRTRGASDAAHNPSGHRYLILLQVGGQDMSRGGVLLSATSKFVTNAAVVNAMKAYLDGYATQQKSYAPLTLAIGTNNDVDVSGSSGASWANNIVDPVASYAGRYPGVVVSGADDIEPGFSADAAQSRAWLTGFLGSTKSGFVFNGSADGCSTRAAGQACNNGWRMTDLQWLSGGAAPTRITSLPQIYNTAMPLQWKYISLTGTSAGRTRINFGGPLTEVTACSQAGSCGSLSNVTAWKQLWAAISSSPATKQYDMPNGTDLRIN